MTWIGILLLVLASIAFLVVVFGVGLFFYAIVRNKHQGRVSQEVWGKNWPLIRDGIDWMERTPYEEMHITSFDGLRLYGRYYPCEGSDRTILCCHGYRSCRENDFAVVVETFHNAGFNLLLIDQRAHGQSEGRFICYGTKERYDVREWINALLKHNSQQRILLHGVSMGAATVLMTAGFELPPNVKGIVADCGFTSPWEEYAYILRYRFKLPKFPVLYVADWISRAFAKYGFRDYSTAQALKTNKLPLLLVHGGEDDFVPTFMGHDNFAYATVEDKKLVIVETAKHAQSYLVERERCDTELKAFWARVIPAKERLA